MLFRLFRTIIQRTKSAFNSVKSFISDKMCKIDSKKLQKLKRNNFYLQFYALNFITNVLDWQEKKLTQACEFLHTDRDINDETRNKLAFLNMSQRKRKSRSKYMDDKYGNEINSTGSFLSDLSVTQSEDDFLEVSKPFKKHRPSTTAANTSYVDKQKRRSGRRSIDQRSKSKFFLAFKSNYET